MRYMIDDRHLDVIKYVPDGEIACASCEHYQGQYQCEAFPEGIPQEILDGKNDHRTPYPGDNCILFKLAWFYDTMPIP